MMMQRTRASLFRAISLSAFAAAPAFAVDDLDTSWNGTGTLVVPTPGMNIQTGDAGTMAMQPDGRILLAGECGTSTSTFTICLARLLPSGALDPSFGPDHKGYFALSQFAPYAAISTQMGPHGLLRQADGKIVVAGDFIDSNGVHAMAIRLLADGTLDTSVDQPVLLPAGAFSIEAIAQQADGKLVVVGKAFAGNNGDFLVARLRTDLTLDPAFNGSGMHNIGFDLGGNKYDAAEAVAIQRDGKIVVAGSAEISASANDIGVARLNADGSRDTSFGSNAIAWFDVAAGRDNELSAIRIDAAGRIWLAGTKEYADPDYDFFVARVLADGSALDNGFCGDGFRVISFDLDSQATDTATDMLLQSDGKIVVAGYAHTATGPEFAAARILPDNCHDDPEFGDDGILHGAFVPTLPISRVGAIALAGSDIVMGGVAADSAGHFGVAMIHLDLIFKNGFDLP